MSNVLARAAEVLGAHGDWFEVYRSNTRVAIVCAECSHRAEGAANLVLAMVGAHQAQMLADAGLLADAGWWEGVNDQWKHRPEGHRLLELKNPYRVGRGIGGTA